MLKQVSLGVCKDLVDILGQDRAPRAADMGYVKHQHPFLPPGTKDLLRAEHQ